MKKKVLFCMLVYVFSLISSESSENNKYAVLVLTTGRAGSSALAGMLGILGLNLGNNLFGANSHNPKGYFENMAVGKVNEGIIADVFPDTPQGLSKRIACKRIDWAKYPLSKKLEYEKQITEHLKKTFSGKTFALKDPRITFLLPLYLSALKKLNYIPKIIIQLREPQEIMQSMVKQTNRPQNERHFYNHIGRALMSVLEYIGTTERVVLYFDDLLHNTEEVVNKLHSFIPGLKTFDESKNALAVFLDKDLKHQNS